MRDLSFNLLCMIGTIYLLCRVTIFLKTLVQLTLNSKETDNKLTKDDFSELCCCSLTSVSDSK